MAEQDEDLGLGRGGVALDLGEEKGLVGTVHGPGA